MSGQVLKPRGRISLQARCRQCSAGCRKVCLGGLSSLATEPHGRGVSLPCAGIGCYSTPAGAACQASVTPVQIFVPVPRGLVLCTLLPSALLKCCRPMPPESDGTVKHCAIFTGRMHLHRGPPPGIIPQCSQCMQKLQSPHHGLCRGRCQPLKLHHVINAQRLQLQHSAGQLAALHLGHL